MVDNFSRSGGVLTFGSPPLSPRWYSQPRANFDSSVDASIENALSDTVFPIYNPTSTKWTITNIGCDTVKYTATIPTVDLISNGTGNCKVRSSQPVRRT